MNICMNTKIQGNSCAECLIHSITLSEITRASNLDNVDVADLAFP